MDKQEEEAARLLLEALRGQRPQPQPKPKTEDPDPLRAVAASTLFDALMGARKAGAAFYDQNGWYHEWIDGRELVSDTGPASIRKAAIVETDEVVRKACVRPGMKIVR